jgi:hypothetical protein
MKTEAAILRKWEALES